MTVAAEYGETKLSIDVAFSEMPSANHTTAYAGQINPGYVMMAELGAARPAEELLGPVGL